MIFNLQDAKRKLAGEISWVTQYIPGESEKTWGACGTVASH